MKIVDINLHTMECQGNSKTPKNLPNPLARDQSVEFRIWKISNWTHRRSRSIRLLWYTRLLSLIICLTAAATAQSHQPQGQQPVPFVWQEEPTNPANPSGYRLPQIKEFFIVAPKQVRPEQTYNVYVTVSQMLGDSLRVRATLTRDGVEYASGFETFSQPSMKRIQMAIAYDVGPGTHLLKVEGVSGDSQTGLVLFRNETEVRYQSKHVSLFVQMEKPVYHCHYSFDIQPETGLVPVNFRVIGVNRDLTPANGAMTIYIRDINGVDVMRLLSLQLRFGVYEGRFDISYPVAVGTWYVVIDAFGYVYKHPFEVVHWYFHRYEVNVTAPFSVFDTDAFFVGSIRGEHMSNKEAYGNASMLLRCRDANGTFLDGEIYRNLGYVRGTEVLFYSLAELFGVWGEALYGRELFLEGWLYDWELEETQNGTAVTKVLRDGAEIKRLGGPFTSFHPGKPFKSYFAVQRPDGSPYNSSQNRLVNVYVTYYGAGTQINEDVAIIPEDSIVRVKVVPRMDDTRIAITVSHAVSSSEDTITAYKYYSFNGLYVSLTTSTQTPETNTYTVFTLRTNFFATECYYMLIANGDIMSVDTLTMYAQQKTFSVAMSRQLMPRGRVIVYCIVHGVVIMDTLNFFVYDTMLTNASIEKNLGKDFRQDTIEIIGKEKKGSFIGLNGVHYDFYKRGAATFLTREKVVDELSTYDVYNQGPFQHNWYYDDPKWDGSVYFTSDTNGLDPNSTLKSSGIAVITDMRISFAQQDEILCNASLALGQCMSGECFPLSALCDGVAHCLDGYDEAACPLVEQPTRKPPELKLWSPNRHYFYQDNMWTFRADYLKPNKQGQVELKLNVPETTENIVFGAFFMNPDTGLTLAHSVVMHDTRRRFFMKCEAPILLKRGEQLGVRCALFNFYHLDLETLITLHGSDDYKMVVVEESMVTSSYAPRLLSGDLQTMVYLYSGEQRYFYFSIIPVISFGEIVVTVSSMNTAYSDVEELTIAILVEGGGLNYDEWTILVDLYDKPSVITPYVDVPIPEQFWQPQKRELLYIPESNLASISVWGDVVHPGFFENVFNYDLASGYPQDSGDGYIFEIAFNFILMDYLKALNVLHVEVEATVVKYIKSILMRHYAYTDSDGGYKMFRGDPSLVWLTAVSLGYLDAVSKSQWGEDIYIPSQMLNKIGGWLVSQQNGEGAFVESTDLVYHSSYHPYSTDENGVNHTWHIATTAQCVMTLAEANRLTGDTASRVQGSVSKGAEYLASKLDHITDPLQMALTSYALHVAGHSAMADSYVKLKSMRREAGGDLYWADSEIAADEVIVIDNRPLLQSRGDNENLASATHATSLALLLHLAHGEMEASKPIMSWLVVKRGSLTCWSGSLDTLLATHALAEFSKRETNHQFYNMEFTLQSTAHSEWQEKVYLNGSNIGQLFDYTLRPAWGEIFAYTKGTGYAIMSAESMFTVEKPWQVYDVEDYETFNAEFTSVQFSGRNASRMELSMCLNWLRPDLRKSSAMVVWWFELPSGFMLDRDETERVQRSYPFVKRAHFRANGDLRPLVWILIDRVPTEPLCFTIRLRRWYPIANVSISHYWMLNEYYETGMYRCSSYSTYTLFHQHVCQVCASFQCPYCPWYNTAAQPRSVHPAAWGLVVLLVLGLIHRRLNGSYFPSWCLQPSN